VEAINNRLVLDRKYQSKKWWIPDVVEILLPLHLAYNSEFSEGQQTAGWLSEKATVHKSKFETNQKNLLNDLAKKRKAEEDETASEHLVEAFKQFKTPPAQAENVTAMVGEKLAAIKNDTMQEIGVKMEKSAKEVKDTLTSISDLVQGLSGIHI
jgi:ATP-dependent 26S proteasome regulatory subunit